MDWQPYDKSWILTYTPDGNIYLSAPLYRAMGEPEMVAIVTDQEGRIGMAVGGNWEPRAIKTVSPRGRKGRPASGGNVFVGKLPIGYPVGVKFSRIAWRKEGKEYDVYYIPLAGEDELDRNELATRVMKVIVGQQFWDDQLQVSIYDWLCEMDDEELIPLMGSPGILANLFQMED